MAASASRSPGRSDGGTMGRSNPASSNKDPAKGAGAAARGRGPASDGFLVPAGSGGGRTGEVVEGPGCEAGWATAATVPNGSSRAETGGGPGTPSDSPGPESAARGPVLA